MAEKRMPRYFFDVRDGGGLHRDEIGEEFGSFEEARAMVHILLPDVAQSEAPDGDEHDASCDLRDETDRVVYRSELTYQEKRS